MTEKADPVAGLPQSAGTRATASADRARRIEAAVRLEWQDVVQKRIGRRRAALIAASCLTCAALIALILHTHVRETAPEAAAVPRRDGHYLRINDENRPLNRRAPHHMLLSYAGPSR